MNRLVALGLGCVFALACSGGNPQAKDGGTGGGVAAGGPGGSSGGGSGGSAGGTAGQGGAGGGTTPTGQLTITVTSPVPDVDLSLEAPDNSLRVITGTVTLTGLAPGPWRLRANSVSERDAVAARVFVPDKADQVVLVVAAQTATLAVKYEADATTGLVYLITHLDPLPSVGPLRAHVRVFQASDLKTGGLKNPLHVAELPDCRSFNAFLDHRDRIWIACTNRQARSEWRRFSRAQLGSEAKPLPEATLSIPNTRRLVVDRLGHVWSWDTSSAWVGKHADSDFELDGDAGFPAADAGFTRGSHWPRFFLKDGSLFGWDYLSRTFGRYDAASLASGGDVIVAAVVTPDAVIGTDAQFVRYDETALYVRWAQRLFAFPLDSTQDGGLVTPTRDFPAPDGVETLVAFDASRRYWSYNNQRNAYVVLTPDQLAADSGTTLTPAWEVSWPPADVGERYGILLFYPPPNGQRYAGF